MIVSISCWNTSRSCDLPAVEPEMQAGAAHLQVPAPSSMHAEICIRPGDQRFRCRPQESVLHAVARLGQSAIPVGCRGGGCGVCRIRVLRGAMVTRRMSRAHISAAEEAEGITLACRTFPLEDLDIEVLGPRSGGDKACPSLLQGISVTTPE